MLDGGAALWAEPYRRRNACAGRLCAPRSPVDRYRVGHPTGGGAMSDSDLMFRPAIELAGMVRSGEVSARELVECSLERIEELNPMLNAFVGVAAGRPLGA